MELVIGITVLLYICKMMTDEYEVLIRATFEVSVLLECGATSLGDYAVSKHQTPTTQ
jgi:hypothetical protein